TPALLGLGLFFGYPLVASVFYSFTRYNLLSDPEWIGLRNYQYLFTEDPKVWAAAGNTLWFVVILVPVRLLTSLGVAGLLVRARQASGFWRTAFYLHALGIQGPLWFSDPSLAKPSLVLLGVWVMGDVMIIFLAALLDVPREQYEAAELDGANAFQRGRYVTFPNIIPVLVFAAVTGVIAALQYFT